MNRRRKAPERQRPTTRQPGSVGHHGGEEGEASEGCRVHQRAKHHHQNQPRPCELSELRSQRRPSSRLIPVASCWIPLRMPRAAGRQRAATARRWPASREPCRAPTHRGHRRSWPPSCRTAARPARVPSCRRDQRGGSRQSDGKEPCVRERGDDSGGEQDGEACGDGAQGVSCCESEDEPEEAGAPGPVTGKRGHQGGPDDHAGREGRGEGSCCPDRDVKVRGDVRQEAGEHELRGAHGEDRHGKQVQRERHRVAPR
ncbi:hypothetical protein EDD96_3129 [Streptomyces sp. Ag109_G2-6]|nr:hypothetical protein EDD96_3129 [Streptomyces sp. Ag109_G2-6]